MIEFLSYVSGIPTGNKDLKKISRFVGYTVLVTLR